MVEIKNALIIGGTGTLGTALIKALHPTTKITVLSRDEHKQQVLKKKYPDIKFVLGDIRDLRHHKREFQNKDIVFHVAALKHIDHLEDNPVESVKTNVLGTINVAEACVEANVPFCVFSSTDKAVDPLNSYGYSKALSEKVLLNYNQSQKITQFSIYRWGNVINSNGSVVPFFVNCLKNRSAIPITNEKMSRFWIRIEDAVSFILKTFHLPITNEKVMIHPEMKSSTLLEVVDALADLVGVEKYETKIIGLRKGEKLHEALRSQHDEFPITSDSCEKYSKEELKEILKEAIL